MCKLCNQSIGNRQVINSPIEGDTFKVECPIAGVFSIKSNLEDDLASLNEHDRAKILYWTKHHPNSQIMDQSVDNLVQDVFKPAAKEAGDFEAIRIDSKEHNNNIDDEIIAEIKESRFLIADLTGNRGGVYWEAGFAEGLGITVIYTCREDELNQVHFDVNHRKFIPWKKDDLEQFKKDIVNRIKATLL